MNTTRDGRCSLDNTHVLTPPRWHLNGVWVALISVFLLTYFFTWRETERERERERESQAGSALSTQSLTQGSDSQTVRSWPEPKSRVRGLTDRATWAPPKIKNFLSIQEKKGQATYKGIKTQPVLDVHRPTVSASSDGTRFSRRPNMSQGFIKRPQFSVLLPASPSSPGNHWSFYCLNIVFLFPEYIVGTL